MLAEKHVLLALPLHDKCVSFHLPLSKQRILFEITPSAKRIFSSQSYDIIFPDL